MSESHGYHVVARAARRHVPWWSRFGYVQRALPRAIEAGIASLRLQPGMRVLDFGCADQPYRALLPDGVEYVGADLPGNTGAALHLQEDGTLPAPNAHFDTVLSTQVLEHVSDPAAYLAECVRVLRPGGQLLLSTHGMMIYHPDPDDYWRWTSAGLRRQATNAGLTVLEVTGVVGLAATGLQWFQDGIAWRLPRRLRPLWSALLQPLVAIVDRFDKPASRAMNALVFIVRAEKPAAPPTAVPPRGSVPQSPELRR